jgi:hypothetical protein
MFACSHDVEVFIPCPQWFYTGTICDDTQTNSAKRDSDVCPHCYRRSQEVAAKAKAQSDSKQNRNMI